jgi:hypothetical protein
MKRFLLAAAFVLWLISPVAPSAAAQARGRVVWLTALFDYARGTVEFDGTVITPDSGAPDLRAWGFAETLPSWKDANGNWYVHGTLAGARLVKDDTGTFHLQIKSLALAPGDKLTWRIPFVNLDYNRIDPPPDNLHLLTSPPLPANTPPSLIGLQYDGGSGRTVDLDLPFTPIRKQITLQAIPLIGEMLLGRTDSFRIAGRVIFDGLTDYGEFNRHCATDPGSRVLYRYRTADLLFALDGMPVYNSGLLSAAYQMQPRYLLASVDLTTCQFDAKKGRVEATFSGRAFASTPTLASPPPSWFPPNQSDANQVVQLDEGGSEYELRLGSIALAPGDVLTVTVPATEIHDVQPPPTRYVFSRDRTPEIVYAGPARFSLHIRYAPQADLFLRQIPATLRALVHSIEITPRPLLDPRGAPLTWTLLILGLALLAAQRFAQGRLALIASGLGWTLAAIALYFGLRGAFGLLVLAVLAYVESFGSRKRFATELTRALIALALILAAMYADSQAENIFTLLTTLQLESTPVTPAIFLVLGAALAAVVAFPREQIKPLFPRLNNAVVLVLIAFASFDVLQKSLLGLAVIGVGMLYLARRASRIGDKMHGEQVIDRLKTLWKSRFVPIGIALMILFAVENGLPSTSAILGSTLGLAGAVLMPVLLLISVVQGFLTIGALFIMVYPALPFKAGYLKALTLGLFLLALFLVGTGADDRLISSIDSLVVGRLVYYVSVPLLIGLYFDIVQFMRAEQAKQLAEGKPAAALTIEQAAPMYFKQLQGWVGTLGALASLVAPGAYALFAGTPLVTTYFDIIGKLAAVSLGG